ncbi:MAG TPA: DsbA family protein [Thermomicrobiales bacterium]|nr:DsbA family protein [Thermomicrobiales bacterium]
MPEPARIAMYADLACPYAYVAAYRMRQLRDEYRGRVGVMHKSLALEYVNREPTPKPVLDAEAPLVLLAEPDIPYRPWGRPDSAWPVTLWPAFEAVKCAERQDPALADDLDWAIRAAFFADHRCVSLRHVLLDLAGQVGLDMGRFAADFDGGVAKAEVLREAREGWERLKVEGSPTFVSPAGKRYNDLGLPRVDLDERRNYRVTAYRPAPCSGDDCLDLYRRMLEEVSNEQ